MIGGSGDNKTSVDWLIYGPIIGQYATMTEVKEVYTLGEWLELHIAMVEMSKSATKNTNKRGQIEGL